MLTQSKLSVYLSYSSILATSTIVTHLPGPRLAPLQSILHTGAGVCVLKCKCSILLCVLQVKYATLPTRPFFTPPLPPSPSQFPANATVIFLFEFLKLEKIFFWYFMVTCLWAFPSSAPIDLNKLCLYLGNF